jgi:hypothetical protein
VLSIIAWLRPIRPLIAFAVVLLLSLSMIWGIRAWDNRKTDREIAALTDQLVYRTVGDTIVISPTWEEHQKEIDALLAIARRSRDSRTRVIRAVLSIQGDHSWASVAKVLGDLKAVEGTEFLIRHAHVDAWVWYSMGGSFESHYPAARALVEIGDPAVPKLIEALAKEDAEHRFKAQIAYVLMDINNSEGQRAAKEYYARVAARPTGKSIR